MHASRIRPDAGPLDRRRLAAAGLSALLPGLGQAFNRRPRLALLFLVPSLVVLGVGLLLWVSQSPARLVAWAVTPSVMGTLLTLNLLLLVWRLVAMFQAFLDTRLAGPTSRLGVIGLAALTVLVVVPHVLVFSYGSALSRTFDRVFSGGALGATSGDQPAPAPALDQRINVLLIGIDKTRLRTTTLTDTMMVVSLDPVGKTISMLSVPRDLINVPLNGTDVYGPKINSLYAYADRHPDEFPKGGVAALEGAIGALLGIHIDSYATMDFSGLIKMVDAVGGVDIDVKDAFNDPTYDGYGLHHKRGFSISEGPPSSRRRRGARLRPLPQGARRERLRPSFPTAGDPGGAPLRSDEGRDAPVPAPRAARRGRCDRPDGSAGRAPATAGGARRRGPVEGRDPGRHPPPAGGVEVDAVRVVARPGPDRHPSRGRGAVPAARRHAGPLADTQADQGPGLQLVLGGSLTVRGVRPVATPSGRPAATTMRTG